MPKTRRQIPRVVRDQVLKEFNHRCSICAADQPHLHHIDEDPSNNDPENIIPLCPNCHLVDQHDASNAIPRAKLLLFRRYKHRRILKPQFNSLSVRIQFLSDIGATSDVRRLEQSADELIDFVENLVMGPFFSKQLEKLIKPPKRPHVWFIGDPESEARREQDRLDEAREYRAQLDQAKRSVECLIVELLDHQQWP